MSVIGPAKLAQSDGFCGVGGEFCCPPSCTSSTIDLIPNRRRRSA
jgi:hypothetical protein